MTPDGDRDLDTRRDVLKCIGAIVTTTGIAGCSGDGGEGTPTDGGGGGTPTDGGGDGTPTDGGGGGTPTDGGGGGTPTDGGGDGTPTDGGGDGTPTDGGGGGTGIDSVAGAFRRSPSSAHAPGDGAVPLDWLDERPFEVLKVTTLDGAGEGSLRWALNQTGPRLVVFEVGGVIDLEGDALTIENGKVVVAGQTAPSPGITLIRDQLATDGARDVVLQHLRVRPGSDIVSEGEEPGGEGHAVDAVGIGGSNESDTRGNVIVDHCSVTWGSDEGLSVARQPMEKDDAPSGTEPVTIANTIIAETMDNSELHPEPGHSYGSLLYSGYEYSLVGNLWANNSRRNPWIGRYYGPCQGTVVNNFVLHATDAAITVDPNGDSRLSFIGNKFVDGKSNVNLNHFPRSEGLAEGVERMVYFDDSAANVQSEAVWDIVDEPPTDMGGIEPIPRSAVKFRREKTVGARPADRTHHDQRIIDQMVAESGEIIDSDATVGGYPDLEPTMRPLEVPEGDAARGEWLYQHTRAVEEPNVDPP
jgi:hypothetical protein